MIKRVENILNDIFKLEVNKLYIDKFTIFTVYISMLFMMIPRYVLDVTGSSMAENIFHGIYFVFLIPYLYIFIHNIKNKYHKNSIDFVLLTIYLLIVSISTMFCSNPFLSLLGNTSRNDGLLTLFIYYLIYVDSKNIRDKNDVMKIINIFLIYALLSTIYALVQVYLPSNIFSAKYFGHMGYGFQGNPNFFGTYTLLFSLISLFITLFISNNKLYKMSTIAIYIGLVLAQSSGPFFTFIFMLFILIIYILIKRRDLIKKIIVWLVIFISLFGIVNYSLIYVNKNIYGVEVGEHYTISGDIKSIVDTLYNYFNKNNISSDELHYETDVITSSRLTATDEVIKYIKRDNHIWLGSGIDNLNIYTLRETDNDNMVFLIFDKAHNIYLNIVAETGIFSFIAYISWMIIVLVYGIKSKNKYVYLLLFGLIGYNIQGIFNINVIYVMPYYYILTGMMMGLIEGDRHESRKH